MFSYVPPAASSDGEWEWAASCEASGFDEAKLDEAVAFAIKHEVPWQKDLKTQLEHDNHFESPPHNAVLGHLLERGGPSGMIIRGGKVVKTWGDVDRPDVAFSCSKSVLGTLYGIAFDDPECPLNAATMVRPVCELLKYEKEFNDSARHKLITWEHLLTQTSEWEGSLFDKSERIDRNRSVGAATANKHEQTSRDFMHGFKDEELCLKGDFRELCEPGEHFEYNDVRVNLAALALLQLTQTPAPELLRDGLFDRIGASSSWAWHGYGEHSLVTAGGEEVESVSGGAHWGGGLHASTSDLARFGLLLARRGQWGGEQLLSQEWIERMTLPSERNPNYGYLWWLNTGGEFLPEAAEHTYFAAGAGGNCIAIDAKNDLVVVWRWLDNGRDDAHKRALWQKMMDAVTFSYSDINV